jgi:hypothetical protein
MLHRSLSAPPEAFAYGRSMPTRVAVWTKEKRAGYEFAEVTVEPDRLSARGVAIGGDPVAYRLDYVLETGPGFVTTLLDVSSRGAGWSRRLVLRRDGAGAWTVDAGTEGNPDLPAAGGDAAELAGALDCDLGLSPVTNLMPIMRHELLSPDGGQVELTMAWVSVPDLAVELDGQRYTGAGQNRVRYDALDGHFSATITLDDDGLVADYPGVARRI